MHGAFPILTDCRLPRSEKRGSLKPVPSRPPLLHCVHPHRVRERPGEPSPQARAHHVIQTYYLPVGDA
jgi:hypothetical protein